MILFIKNNESFFKQTFHKILSFGGSCSRLKYDKIITLYKIYDGKKFIKFIDIILKPDNV